MSRRTWRQWFSKHFGLPRESTPRRSMRRVMALEALGQRLTPAINAFFSHGVLTVIGDNQDNTITVSRDAAGALVVNGGAITIKGGAPTVASTKLIQMFGAAGNDTLSLDETNGALPRANLYGAAGNDTLTGGSGSDQLFGQAGDDTLLGKGGVDSLFGGSGHDVLTGGAAFDQAFGQAGDDRMIWNPGDGSDLNEGGAGSDTVEVIGGNAGETFTTTANGNRVRFDRTDPLPFFIDIGTTENLVLNAGGGDDRFTATGDLASLIALHVDGGAGNDTLLGGNGADRLSGGDGNDLVDGNGGSDTAFLGAGDDTFQWDPGDGSDTVEGQEGDDTMLFNGANLDENISLSANGNRLLLFRDPGAVTMDTAGVENVTVNALGGADTITVNDLTLTDVTQVNLDLANPQGSGAGDGQMDNVIVNGTAGNDGISVVGDATGFAVLGLSAQVNIVGTEPADKLTVLALAGDDVIDAASLDAGVVSLLLDGADGDDVLVGSDGDDTLLGGVDDDVLVGGPGLDVLDGGSGDNVLLQD